MSYANELGLAETWLYARLTGDTALVGLVGENIYNEALPDDAEYPAVLFAYQRSQDIRGNGPRRYLSDVVYTVKVIGTGPKSELRPVADRIDAALNAKSSETVAMCVREQMLSFPEREGDTVYHHLGGLYRIRVLPTAS